MSNATVIYLHYYTLPYNYKNKVSIVHNYDKLELVESKHAQEVANPHCYNVSIKDGEVKSKDGHKASWQIDKSSEQSNCDTCRTQQERIVATDTSASDGTLERIWLKVILLK